MANNLKTIRPESKYFSGFENAFRKRVHTLLSWGYKGALNRIKHNSQEETTITGYIAESITNRLYTFSKRGWYSFFSVKENNPVEMDGCEGKTRPQPDLIIEGTIEKRSEYIFEAKRLKKKDFGTGKYLGQDGLGCFLSGKYAGRYDEAAMLGYIQSDSPEGWQTDIREKINQKKTDLHLISPSQDVDIINDFPNEWKSTHHREVIGRSITIFHILLDFRARG